MRKLQVYVELSGKQVHVGNIHGNGPDDACIEYDKKYIETQGAMPISLSLPFLNQEYDSEKTKYFFEGLLPEGFTRRCVAEWMHVEEWVFLHSVNSCGEYRWTYKEFLFVIWEGFKNSETCSSV